MPPKKSMHNLKQQNVSQLFFKLLKLFIKYIKYNIKVVKIRKHRLS